MNAFKWLLLLPVLLMQAMPLASWGSTKAHPIACQMGCCAWLVEAGLSEECGCIEKTNPPSRQSPAAPNAEAGWIKVVQPVGFLTLDRFQPASAGTNEVLIKRNDVRADRQWQVRLAVLFCSFLN